ncbi:hypothetical protein HD554DRAFT_2070528 [Boletus coccyginus]|nr:hypothetical protein HD554DRAFT_2070528 [Boletus coccyginus]
MASRSFAVLSLLVSLVFAQSSNPLIPSDSISASCTSFLTALNANTALIACTTPFTTALQQFAPGASGASSATIDSALGTLCQSDAFSACPQSTVTNQLGAFYAACEAELTSNPNQSVKTTYDVLYALVPIREAICSKNDSGDYCVTQLSNSSNAGVVALADPGASQQHALLTDFLYTTTGSGAVVRRGVSDATALVPNTTTYKNTNLLFMFLDPSTSIPCTTCTRNIITPYIDFESACPYGPGLSNSLLLAGQVSLYNNITTDCGSGFLSGAVQAAGGLSSGLLSGAAPLVVGQELSAAVSLILGVAAFAVASL